MAHKQAAVHHGWINTICLSGALLGYNIVAVIRHHLGKGGLLRLFLSPLPGVNRALISTVQSPEQLLRAPSDAARVF
jgi:hypothetical protein